MALGGVAPPLLPAVHTRPRRTASVCTRSSLGLAPSPNFQKATDVARGTDRSSPNQRVVLRTAVPGRSILPAGAAPAHSLLSPRLPVSLRKVCTQQGSVGFQPHRDSGSFPGSAHSFSASQAVGHRGCPGAAEGPSSLTFWNTLPRRAWLSSCAGPLNLCGCEGLAPNGLVLLGSGACCLKEGPGMAV